MPALRQSKVPHSALKTRHFLPLAVTLRPYLPMDKPVTQEPKPDSKSGVRVTVPWVRIPPLPLPDLIHGDRVRFRLLFSFSLAHKSEDARANSEENRKKNCDQHPPDMFA